MGSQFSAMRGAAGAQSEAADRGSEKKVGVGILGRRISGRCGGSSVSLIPEPFLFVLHLDCLCVFVCVCVRTRV